MIKDARKVPEHFDILRMDRDINIILPPTLFCMASMRDENVSPHIEKELKREERRLQCLVTHHVKRSSNQKKNDT